MKVKINFRSKCERSYTKDLVCELRCGKLEKLNHHITYFFVLIFNMFHWRCTHVWADFVDNSFTYLHCSHIYYIDYKRKLVGTYSRNRHLNVLHLILSFIFRCLGFIL